mgnify:CR=1 FL=1
MSSKHIDFYFDLSSPYSYLAATQLDAIANRHGATIAWKPLVLAAVFKAQGNVMPAVCVPKAQYMVKDLARWAEHYGVPFQMSSRFPLPTQTAARAYYWLHGQDCALARQFAHAALVELLGEIGHAGVSCEDGVQRVQLPSRIAMASVEP